MLSTLKDLVEDMSEEEREVNPWTREDGNIIMGMIIMSKEARRLIHSDTHKHPSPYQLLEVGGSQGRDTDSLASGAAI